MTYNLRGGEAFAALESSFVQTMTFSVVLLTLALTFKRAAIRRDKDFPIPLVDLLSAYVAFVAFSFGFLAVYAYVSRVKIYHFDLKAERLSYLGFCVLGALLLLAECAVTFMVFLRRPPRESASIQR